MSDLRKEIENAINRNSAENGSDTPDFILAEYLTDCLAAYDRAVCAREKWYGRSCGGLRGPIPVDGPPPPPVEELLLFQPTEAALTTAKSKDWPGFDEFWLMYPRKEGRKPALKSWNKEKPDIQEVAKALTWQTQTEQWRKGFIPLPTTYLNQRRWEDERPPETKPEQVYQ
jgi:hypothetical protein